MVGKQQQCSNSRRLMVMVAVLTLGLTMCKDAGSDRDGTGDMSGSLNALSLPADCRQVMLVKATNWDSSEGELTLYERADGESEWQNQGGDPIPVMLGRNGMAWGRGLHAPGSEVMKAEGDGKAPAGVFALGTAFGYAESPPENVAWTYRQATDRDFFVDEAASPDYNTWQTLGGQKQPPWESYERMRRDDGKYELGLVVEHNTNPVQAGSGSAIFLHVWGGEGDTTAGCTAMAKPDLLQILQWLDPEKAPVLIQAPSSQISSLNLTTQPST